MKTGIWTRDWFAALVFCALFAVAAHLVFPDAFGGIERAVYDLGVRSRSEAPSDRVAVIAIDDESIANLGRWPWPRNLHAAMIEQLRAGGAKAVGNTIFYFEPQTDPGLAYVQQFQERLLGSSLAGEVPAEIETFGAMIGDLAGRTALARPLDRAWRQSALATRYLQDLDALAALLLEAGENLDVDRQLATTISRAGGTALAMTFATGRPQGRPDQELPDYVRRFALRQVVDRVGARAAGLMPVPTRAAWYPIAPLGRAADRIGHLVSLQDVDGAVRFEPLVVEHFGEYYPSLSLMLAAAALNLKVEDITLRLGEGVTLGNLEIDTTPDLRMYAHFYGERDGRPPFDVDSFFDVFTGRIPASKYKDKVVLIGASALGIGDSFPTPVSPNMAPVETLAHVVSSILQEHFYTRPAWAFWAEAGAMLAVTAYLAFALPALGPMLAAMLTLIGALALVGAELVLMSGSALWLQLALPALLLLAGHLFMTVKRLRLTERLRVSSEAQSAESNKMLGLAFQSQGQLDMAFEKFRSVTPVDDKLLDLLYNLALDYERKRQFNKAEAVYRYIAEHDPGFRDVQEKLGRARKMSETVILGGGTGGGGTLVLDAGEKPMLGRYEVIKELGKGAMGVVYLGRDPKIGREVAIKTMALSQEFEPDELEEVKSRFFREAETAGRLSHPNIVAIYDAGEEHDLAWIAMEFIKGYDLTRHTKPDALLPVDQTLRIIADAADALDYAHQQGVFHRDIKPANLMWLTDRKLVKVTDFGIARLADSSKTKTGMVLGTPSYMSPEQLAGKKIDGRSDLFSLGVTLYQMLTGSLPFRADSMATLMFKIANEPHPPLSTVRPDLPPELVRIIDKALAKDPDQRYQTGAELAADLRAVLDAMK